jgi:hypothetical protein
MASSLKKALSEIFIASVDPLWFSMVQSYSGDSREHSGQRQEQHQTPARSDSSCPFPAARTCNARPSLKRSSWRRCDRSKARSLFCRGSSKCLLPGGCVFGSDRPLSWCLLSAKRPAPLIGMEQSVAPVGGDGAAEQADLNQLS